MIAQTGEEVQRGWSARVDEQVWEATSAATERAVGSENQATVAEARRKVLCLAFLQESGELCYFRSVESKYSSKSKSSFNDIDKYTIQRKEYRGTEMTTDITLPIGTFEKWQACGNDFVLTSTEIPERAIDHINDFDPDELTIGRGDRRPPLKRKAVMRVCDRHFGVGADGVIFIYPSEVADARISIINSDGTEAEMCGNGIRCVGQYLARELKRDKVTVETLAGIKELLIDGLDVIVDMGDVVLRWSKPMYLPGDGIDPTNPQKIYDSNFVDIGNPHCVLFIDDFKEGEVEYYGYMIEHMTDTFPGRTNVEFTRLMNRRKIRVRVWERGCGRTLACGTGACASAYAAFKRDLVDEIVTVELEGGEVEVRMGGDKVIMVGMAEIVYSGTLPAVQ